MQKILTVYNFNLPFISKKFEKIKYISILEDLENLFLYFDIFISKKIKKTKNYEKVIFELKDFKSEIIYYNKNNLYFIPKIEFNFYYNSNNSIEKNLIKNIFEIFISSGKYNYIFDFDEKNISFKNKEVLTINVLKKSFEKYNYNFLKKFLQNTNKDYLEDFLMTNRILRNSFYYLIFLCFKNYQILIKTKKGEEEIKNILKQENLEEYNSNLELQKTRLQILEKNIFNNFILYKNMLDKVFKIFEK